MYELVTTPIRMLLLHGCVLHAWLVQCRSGQSVLRLWQAVACMQLLAIGMAWWHIGAPSTMKFLLQRLTSMTSHVTADADADADADSP